MTQLKIDEIDLRMVELWIREAGRLALRGRDSLNTTSKVDGSIVTDVDHQIELYLYRQICEHYPDHQILAEEGTSRGTAGDFLWVIDPIDGTRAYASGLPVWGVSIGILRGGIPYAGYFYMPVMDELYTGLSNKAFLNNRPLAPSSHTGIGNSTAFIAVPSNAHRFFEISYGRLRSLGSTTAHLAYVGRGTALAALTRQLYIWDVAPVMPILQATGISLKYLSGEAFNLQQLMDASPSPEPLVAAPSSIIDEIRGLIRKKQSP